jgi:hypothetical protein
MCPGDLSYWLFCLLVTQTSQRSVNVYGIEFRSLLNERAYVTRGILIASVVVLITPPSKPMVALFASGPVNQRA